MKSTERLAGSLQFAEGWKAKKAVLETCEPTDTNSNAQSKDVDCMTEVEAGSADIEALQGFPRIELNLLMKVVKINNPFST